ncbi:uncharacterized protein LOC105255826 [Camponotus floridanus]|uniref:uncharacterized protein LOC105255826 n=1 Tax=Camponotus floridanus TaxID=104421 RepID=UPI00059E7EA8|nr:uncharacterized protein LOC105255826 [Camponotus floridanus]
MKFFVVLFAVVAVASAGYIHHAPEIIHVTGGPDIPALKAAPLAVHGDDKTTRIHYSGPHVGHPHLVGIEHYLPAPVYEPGYVNVALKHDSH